MESGGKKTLSIKRIGWTTGGALICFAIGMAYLGPSTDRTFFRRTNEPPANEGDKTKPAPILNTSQQLADLFNNGQRQLEKQKRQEGEQKQKKSVTKYFASQIIGVKSNRPKDIKSGSKLLGFLMNPIDTRNPSLVRVALPHGGLSNSGGEIEKGSVLYGQFSYPSTGDKVFIAFSRLDSPDGATSKISAESLDSGDYTSGVHGEAFTGAGVKIASQLGLTMFSGMADVLTEKESVGGVFNGSVQAKPTMKNALLQGASHAAQDQAGRTASEISSAKDYVIVPEGKEMIIQLTEDLKNERK